METRNKTVSAALLLAALLASQGAVAQGGNNNSSSGSSTGPVSGTPGATGTQGQATGSTSGSGTLMQKREHGMSADRPASSPQSTGKMSQ